MTPLVMLIIGGAAYFAGGLVRAITVMAVLLFMLILARRYGFIEVVVAGGVIWLLVSKGWFTKLQNWLQEPKASA